MPEIPDRRDEGDTTLRKVQLVQIRLLQYADAVCRKHHLKYWLDFGTLIGAVRHKGFIPWDDDIDIAMPLEDYRKFIEAAACELPEDILLQLPRSRNHDYHQNIVKLVDRYSTALTPYDQIAGDRLNGIFLDVFPVVKAPAIPEKLLRFLAKYIHDGYQLIHLKVHVNLKEILRYYYRLWGYRVLRCVWFLLSKLYPGENYIYEPSGSADQVIMTESGLFPLRELEFENGLFYVPFDYDAHLREIYGNYMELPPENERKGKCIVIADPYLKCDHPDALDWNRRKHS